MHHTISYRILSTKNHNALKSNLDFIAMEMSRVNREKGYTDERTNELAR